MIGMDACKISRKANMQVRHVGMLLVLTDRGRANAPLPAPYLYAVVAYYCI